MHRLLPLLGLALLAPSPLAYAQSAPQFGYANEGLRPDGYIDFTQMPPAPVFPSSGASAAFTATLPVHGVPGLTVQVILPSFTGQPGQPIYTVAPGFLTPGGGGTLQLHFSAGIAGLSLENTQSGRFVQFALAASPLDQLPTPIFESAVSAFTNGFSYNLTYPLQMVNNTLFQDAYLALNLDANYDNILTLSNLRVQSAGAAADAEAQVPADGLQMWFRSEDINGSSYAWPDHSGHGHNATAPSGKSPRYVVDGIASQPAYAFGNAGALSPNPVPGAATYLNFNLPINGWTEMTVFLVAQSTTDSTSGTSQNAAIFWQEDASWGNTFVSPYQTHATFRFGTTQVSNQPIYIRPNDIGQDFTVTRAVHNQTTDTLYVDGVPVFTQGGKYASLNGTTGAGTIGLGLNNTPYNGAISEVLVYNRVLTEGEAASVEKYLRTKFRTP